MTNLRQIEIAPRYWMLVCAGWSAVALTGLPDGSAVRVAAVYLFALTVPGFTFAVLLVDDLAERFLLTVAISAALAILVSVGMTVIRNDSAPLRIAVLAFVNTVGAVLLGVRDASKSRSPEMAASDGARR